MWARKCVSGFACAGRIFSPISCANRAAWCARLSSALRVDDCASNFVTQLRAALCRSAHWNADVALSAMPSIESAWATAEVFALNGMPGSCPGPAHRERRLLGPGWDPGASRTLPNAYRTCPVRCIMRTRTDGGFGQKIALHLAYPLESLEVSSLETRGELGTASFPLRPVNAAIIVHFAQKRPTPRSDGWAASWNSGPGNVRPGHGTEM